jgi:hypothetical protein
MPLALFPKLLMAVYRETLLAAQGAPSTILGPDTTVFRAFDQGYFTVDTYRHILRRDQADNALVVRDANADQNRWTGRSGDPTIRSWGGVYCSLQQQALVNEVAHYVQSARATTASASGAPVPAPLPRPATLNQKCVIKIRLLGSFLAADLSPHNPGFLSFIDGIGRMPSVRRELAATNRPWLNMQDAINDTTDCSAARGIGLALASHGFRALVVQTARTSERSLQERGDNLILFGVQGERIANLSVEEAYLFPLVGKPVIYPVEY